MTRFIVALAVLALIAAPLCAERYTYRPKYKSIPPKPKVEETIQVKPIVPPPPSERVYHAPYDVFGTGKDATYTEIDGRTRQLSATVSTVPARPQPPSPPPPQIPRVVYVPVPAAAREVVDSRDKHRRAAELDEIANKLEEMRSEQQSAQREAEFQRQMLQLQIESELDRLQWQQHWDAEWEASRARYRQRNYYYYPPVYYNGGGYRPMYHPVPGYPNGF